VTEMTFGGSHSLTKSIELSITLRSTWGGLGFLVLVDGFSRDGKVLRRKDGSNSLHKSPTPVHCTERVLRESLGCRCLLLLRFSHSLVKWKPEQKEEYWAIDE
jgi:hypothetical protein